MHAIVNDVYVFRCTLSIEEERDETRSHSPYAEEVERKRVSGAGEHKDVGQ